MVKPQDVISLARQSIKESSEDKANRLAAALAYYTILSLAPLLVSAVGIAGLVFGEQAAQGQIVGQIEGLVGRQGAEVVQGLIENANRPSVWIYCSAQIVFLGAEFTQVYANKYGSRTKPLSATRALESETHGADLERPTRTERPR